MPTSTYIPLATTTLASSTATVTFSSIPSSYRDLVIVIDGSAASAGATFLNFNADSSNLSYVRMYGTGSSTGSDTSRIGMWTAQSNIVFQIMDYSATDKHKTYLARANAAGNQVAALASRWASTSAITSILIDHSTSNFDASTTFSLYGIEA